MKNAKRNSSLLWCDLKKTKMKQSKAAVYATGLRPAFLSYPVSLSSADSVLTRCKYFYAKQATGELRYFFLNKLYIIMNTELFKVLNKNN